MCRQECLLKMAEEIKVPGFTKDERRFAVLPSSSVGIIAEAEGHQDVSSEVMSILAEDVTYHLREVIQSACQYMKHAKRKRLNAEDVNKALRCADVQPVFGHGAPEGQPWRQTKEGELYFVEDLEMALPSVACNSQVPNNQGSTTVRANWLVIEGNQKGASLSQTTQGKVNGKIGRGITEDLLMYHENVTKAILGTDQELMKHALTDLRTNPNIAPLLPYLVEFVSGWVKTMNYNPSKLTKLLYTVNALTNNASLFLEPRPYLSFLTEVVMYCLTEPPDLSLNDTGDHWTVRDYAARLLAKICRQSDSGSNRLREKMLSQLSEILHDVSRSFSAHYGVIVALCYFGEEALREILIPYLSHYWEHLMGTLSDVTLLTARLDAHKVCGALLCAADVMIKHTNIHTRKMSSKDSLNSLQEVYTQFYEYFGDSLQARLPMCSANNFKKPFCKESVVTLNDADSQRTGEEMLQEFLTKSVPPSIVKSEPVPLFSDANAFDFDMSCNGDEKSERSSRSERSHSDEGFLGEESNLTVKATVSDPAKGIKLFISKRKSKVKDEDLKKKAGRGKAESKRKRSDSGITKLQEAFEITISERHRQGLNFGFSPDDWKGRHRTSHWKQQKKRRLSQTVNFGQQQKQVKSEYRKLCLKMSPYGKVKKTRKENKPSTLLKTAVTNVGCLL